MSAFGGVPFASVCPWARCVEAIVSPSSSARQTPTATASWPIATWRKPGSSPARKRSSTFSSKRRISSISRRQLRRSSCESACLSSTLAIGLQFRHSPPVTESERACELARHRFWKDDLRRLIGTHPEWPDAGWDLDLPEELAHALV